MEGFAGKKRSREDAEEFPVAKHFHADVLFGILDDDDVDAGDRNPAGHDLATVMKSLEEEIGLLPSAAKEKGEGKHLEIGYLFEASDDELGLPPAVANFSPAIEAEPIEEFGQIWGLEEGMAMWHEGMVEFGISPEEKFGVAVEGYESVDGGLFDFSEFSCWPESLPAI